MSTLLQLDIHDVLDPAHPTEIEALRVVSHGRRRSRQESGTTSTEAISALQAKFVAGLRLVAHLTEPCPEAPDTCRRTWWQFERPVPPQ